MTPDFYDRSSEERDDTLIKGLCGAARNTRLELREWIEGEVRDLIQLAEIQERLSEGVIQERVSRNARRLRQINQENLRNAVEHFDETIDEVSHGGYTDMSDAYEKLHRGCIDLVEIMKELQQIREFTGEMGSN